MAVFRSFYEFDLRVLNFWAVQDASYNARLVRNADVTILGTTHSDVYAYDWDVSRFETHTTAWLGGGMKDRLDGSIARGRVETIADMLKAPGNVLLDYWYITGLDLDARALVRVGNTSSRADDRNLLARMFDGDDIFQMSRGDDHMKGFAGDDLMRGGPGDDTLLGGSGDDRVLGQAGNDQLHLDDGNDRLDGGSGWDWVTATDGRRMTVDLAITGPQRTGYGRDVLRGIENVAGDSGNDRLKGTDRANELDGNGGNDRLLGRVGNDTLRGGDGDDVLIGGKGRDLLTGGEGADLFVFRTGHTASTAGRADVIAGFEQGIDRIDLRGIDASASAARNNAFTFGGEADRLSVAEGMLVFRKVDKGDSHTLILLNTDADPQVNAIIRLTGLYDLTEADFLL